VMEFDVFLSHNSEDKSAVRDLVQLLNTEGMRAWVDEEQLVPGRNWQPLLEQRIQRIPGTVYLIFIQARG
jgi:hypothetical protein